MTTAKFPWPESAISRLRELLEVQNLSASLAASVPCREYGTDAISRNSVIGKASRSGIAFANGDKRKAEQTDRPKPAKPRKPKAIIPAPMVAKPAPKPSAGSVGLLDLSPWHCRWPVEDEPIRFCGDVAAFGKSYCPEHGLRAYRRVSVAKAD